MDQNELFLGTLTQKTDERRRGREAVTEILFFTDRHVQTVYRGKSKIFNLLTLQPHKFLPRQNSICQKFNVCKKRHFRNCT